MMQTAVNWMTCSSITLSVVSMVCLLEANSGPKEEVLLMLLLIDGGWPSTHSSKRLLLSRWKSCWYRSFKRMHQSTNRQA